MDPALQEALHNEESRELEVIVKVQDGQEKPPQLRVVSRFGNILTGRVARDRIPNVWGHPSVLSLKAPRLLDLEWPVLDFGEAIDLDVRHSDLRRPVGLRVTGRGVVLGALDVGCDFAHPSFRNDDGTTRLLALWDQTRTGPERSPAPYGYGCIHTRAEIDRALATGDPYADLGYHPSRADPLGQGAHGTLVLDIAGGNGRLADGPMGIAPDADLVFVHVATGLHGGLSNLGDSTRILEALDFVRQTAAGRPFVVNISMGARGGGHDGTSLLEQGMDALLLEAPGRCIVNSAGNYGAAAAHAAGQLRPGQQRTLSWYTDPADLTPNEMEIWYSGRDRFVIELYSPEDERVCRTALAEDSPIQVRGAKVGHLYHRARDPNNGDNQVDLFLQPAAPAGVWRVALIGEDIVDGHFHAWVERDAACPRCDSRFDAQDADPASTTGTICNGLRTVAVGACDAHGFGDPIPPFSSAGPTRDFRIKPDLVAPGVKILGARSAPSDGASPQYLLTRMSGTSFAAPHVAGTVALMFEAADRPLTIQETRAILLATAGGLADRGVDPNRAGSGRLDIEQAVAAARELAAAPPVQFTQQDSEGRVAMQRDADGVSDLLPNVEEHAASPALIDVQPAEGSLIGAQDAEPAEWDEADARQSDFDDAQDGAAEPTDVGSSEGRQDESEASASAAELAFAGAEEGDTVDGNPEDVGSETAVEMDLIALAESVFEGADVRVGPSALLGRLLTSAGLGEAWAAAVAAEGAMPSPERLFAALSAPGPTPLGQALEGAVEVVAAPRSACRRDLRAGDLLLRIAPGEPGLGHLAVLASPELWPRAALGPLGLTAEESRGGWYGLVIEAGAFPHERASSFVRRVLDEGYRVPADQLLLRVRAQPPTLGSATGVWAEALQAQDVIDPRIDVFAQRALLRMSKSGDPAERADAAGMLAAVKGGELAGIYKEDEQVPALRARRQGKGWWQLIPKGEDAALIPDPAEPPLIVFRDSVRSLPPRLDPALRKAWAAYSPPILVPPRLSPPDIIPVSYPPPTANPPAAGPAYWFDTNGMPPVTGGNKVIELIDGAETFRAMIDAIRSANGPGDFVYMLNWYVDLSFELQPGGHPRGNPASTRLGDMLSEAARKGVQVRGMFWDQAGFKNNRAVDYINKLSTGAAIKDNNTLNNTFVNRFAHPHLVTSPAFNPSGSHHQKILIVKGADRLIAFCGGVDFNPDRIQPTSDLGTPLHDVHCSIEGPAALDLLRIFVERWDDHPDSPEADRRKGALLSPPSGISPPPGPANTYVQIARTYGNGQRHPGIKSRYRDRGGTPYRYYHFAPNGEQTAFKLIAHAVRRATRFIYIEDQYLVSMELCRLLQTRLTHIEYLIILMPHSYISDHPRIWAMRKACIDELKKDPFTKDKVIICCLTNYNTLPFKNQHKIARSLGQHTYLHSKMLIIDDELAIIGSANCGRRGYTHDSEVVAGILEQLENGFARNLRARLWAEHLGETMQNVWDVQQCVGAWINPRSPNYRIRRYDENEDTDSVTNPWNLIPDDLSEPDGNSAPPTPIPPAVIPPPSPGGVAPIPHVLPSPPKPPFI